jgi:Predicted hydrolase of the metallo-beta-lactamase superfamily
MQDNGSTGREPVTKFPVPGTDSMIVIPLGGTERVGMNATLIGYDGRWLLIDAGATFPGADSDRAVEVGELHEGEVDQIVPDLRRLAPIADRLDGIVVTHAHEDHIGALPALYGFAEAWPRLSRVPLYAGAYARGIIRRKLEEVGGKPMINTIAARKPVKIGPFEVTPVRVTHSAPETFMLAVKTPAATIVFGSDTKLDPNPVLGRATDTHELIRLGREGVDAYFGDSTNAAREGRSHSELEVAQGLEALMRRHPGRVVVSTFASNLARVAAIAQAARGTERRLGAFGRTILNNIETALEVQVLAKRQIELVDARHLAQCKPKHAAIVCTGTQAEQGSALMRAVEDLELRRQGRGLQLSPGDLVVHSARVIPGNEATVAAMFDTMRSHGITVVEAGKSDAIVHASGHGPRAELAEMYRMLRPTFAVPVHGHRELIEAHIDLARGMKGVRKAVSPLEGDILRVSKDDVRIVGRIGVGQLAVLSLGGRSSGETKLVAWDNADAISLRMRRQDTRQPRPGQRASAPGKPKPQRPAGQRQGHGRKEGNEPRTVVVTRNKPRRHAHRRPTPAPAM